MSLDRNNTIIFPWYCALRNHFKTLSPASRHQFFCRINRHLSEESFSLGFDRALSVSSYRIECILPSLARCVCESFILIVLLNGIFNHSHVIVALMRALLTDSIDVHIAYIINISDQRVSLSLSLYLTRSAKTKWKNSKNMISTFSDHQKTDQQTDSVRLKMSWRITVTVICE